jgi:hypothetical protein
VFSSNVTGPFANSSNGKMKWIAMMQNHFEEEHATDVADTSAAQKNVTRALMYLAISFQNMHK